MHNNEGSGAVVGIFLRPAASQATLQVEQVQAVAGRGLEGDYFFNRRNQGEQTGRSDSDREVTLIELEALQAVAREYDIHLDLGESRRNLVTHGVPLNGLVGAQFRVGEALLQGIRLCEPCSHLANLTQKNVVPALVHRGGLRARILSGGAIRVGDAVSIPDEQLGQENYQEEFGGV